MARLSTYAQYQSSGGYPYPSGNYSTYTPPAARIATDITTARRCYDAHRNELKATDQDPATYFQYNGDWVCFDTKKGELVEKDKLTMSSACVMYWRPSQTSPIDQTVYVIGQGFLDKTGFANYGSAGYCTNWPFTTWPQQKEMRCWSNGTGSGGNLVWFGWADAQGIRGMPADPGKKLSLESEIRCSGIAPGEWKWRMRLKPVAKETPVARSSAPSETSGIGAQKAANILDLDNGEDAADASEDAPKQKKKVPLIQLLKQKRK